ncbi:MAG: gas vesicle protein GvpG [Candidatus Aminicenantes bacterium]|nr:gas vesicle protein GvpG [Candidatus Aminicenantes bacterium]
MFLLDDIFLAPLKSVIWLGKKINEIFEKELFDEELIKEKLMELQFKYEYELEPMSEEDYRTKETELLERLDAIRKAKEEV